MTDQITSVIAQATLKDSMHNADHRLDAATHSAKKLARKLFEGLDEDKGGVLTRDEFEPYFKNRAEAIEAFKVFDKDGNGDIDRKEMRNAVSRIYRERRALATSLKVGIPPAIGMAVCTLHADFLLTFRTCHLQSQN
jgi:Ca2+-binding EF-hand superfamily protein